MGDKTKGMFHKFRVERTDGTSAPGEKHHGCQYLVLDLDHDPHARTAALTYAAAVEADGYNQLAGDLRALVLRILRDRALAPKEEGQNDEEA